MLQTSNHLIRLLPRLTCALALLLTGVLGADAAQASPRDIPSTLPVVEHVDLERYAGKWFEIVSPRWSATGSCNDAVNLYTATDTTAGPTTRLSAVHSCRRAGLLIHRADGTLFAPNASAPGRLLLEAKSTLGSPSYTHYDIIGLDAQYQWAVVGDDTRRYVWILSRTPDMDISTLQNIFEHLNSHLGYRNVQKSVSCVAQSTAKTQNCKAALSL